MLKSTRAAVRSSNLKVAAFPTVLMDDCWDQVSSDPDYDALSLGAFELMVRAVFSGD